MTGNPIADARIKDMEDEEYLSLLPICHKCGNPIQQDEAIYYNDQWICEECEFDFWEDIRSDFLEKIDEES